MKLRHVFAIAASVLLLDQISKIIVLKFIGIGNEVNIFSWMSLNVSLNNGIILGLFRGANLLFAFITLIVLGIALFYIDRLEPYYLIPAGLILGGGIGNLIDRIFHSAVVDFIDLRVWPVFNIADSAISIGVIASLYLLWKYD
ncbi:signal peptidase II [Candidatus Woesearchaeota archaeon]|nr:signal peptidase II [Candidatus Woesearchaeota archaeon]